jgi:putative Holliday junction resolvase
VVRLAALCTQLGVRAVVVGLPYELDGAEGRSARLARQVGEALGSASGLQIHYQDERYSTVEASRRLREAGHSAKAQRKIIDQAAAAVILEDWLLSS